MTGRETNLSKRIGQGLEEWARGAHSSRFFDFYLGLLRIQAEAEDESGVPAIKLDAVEIARRIESGHSILSHDDLAIDRALFNRTFRRIAALFDAFPEMLGPSPESVRGDCFEVPGEWLQAWFRAEPPAVEECERQVTFALIHQSLRPFLIGYAGALKGSFSQDKWRRSHCPVCGGSPEFAFLEKEVGARWLLCSACSTEWLFKRLQCPYCDNSDSSRLSYLASDDGAYRLYLCEQCKSYLKAVDLRKAPPDTLIPLASLTTVDMDSRGQELGYHRGA